MGMDITLKTAPDPVCEPCLTGKMHTNPFKSTEFQAKKPLELVHTDVHDVGHPSVSGFCYWVSFIDDYSRFKVIYPLEAKSDILKLSSNTRPSLKIGLNAKSRCSEMIREESI